MQSDQQDAASVYDVLYADIRRLSSLLSQFSDDGIVTELTRAAEESSSSDIGLSVKLLKAASAETGRTSSSRKFDPQWLLPLLFLDRAQDIISRDITSATIGSLVLVSGKLVVTDLGVLKEMWKAPAMRRHMVQLITPAEEETPGNRHDRRLSAKTAKKKDTTEQEAIIELLQHLPHTPQLNIITADHAVWSTIDPTYMISPVSDLLLKHGAKVAGTWTMVGILDAKPFENRDDGDYDDHDDILSLTEQIHLGMMQDSIWKAAIELAAPVREAFGRPLLSYGATPLMIFREIGAG